MTPSDEEVLGAVRTHWDDAADDVEHLPTRSGRHWRVRVHGRPALLATLDATSREQAHAAAATLAFRLDFVVAGLPTHDLRYTVPVTGGRLGCTPWVWGEPPPDDRATAEATAVMLRRLHAVTPPPDLPRWEPPAGEATSNRSWVVTHGDPGPHHQLVTPVRTLLVGWGSLLLAPAERDLWRLAADHPDLVDADPAMLRLFRRA